MSEDSILKPETVIVDETLFRFASTNAEHLGKQTAVTNCDALHFPSFGQARMDPVCNTNG